MKPRSQIHPKLAAWSCALGALLCWAGAGATSALAQALSINPASREDTRVFYNTIYQASENVPPGWTGSIAGCNAGVVSSAYQEATLLRVNYFRAMAGLPATITFTETNNFRAQAAALMMAANQNLNHNPPTTWTCYTDAGAVGARSSNLNMGSSGATSIDSFMQDGGSNNKQAGHRRWILKPNVLTMGSGHIPSSGGTDFQAVTAALWVFGDRAPQPPAARDEFVAWPPKGFVPYQVVYPRWSFGLAKADFSGATVTMQRNGVAVPVTIEDRVTSTIDFNPDSSIIWIPNNLNDSAAWSRPAADETYTVNVNNVMVGGTARNFSYTVAIFDPTVPGADYQPAVITGTDTPPLNQSTPYNFTGVPNATAHQWRVTKLTPLNLTDGAENGLVNFTTNNIPDGTQVVDTTVKASGNASYRLKTSFASQNLTFNRTLLANASSQITFKSRFENIRSQSARVEVSTDGGSVWVPAFNQTGTEIKEGVFSDKVVSLGAYAGSQVMVRFSMEYIGGPASTCCDPLGWYIDDIAFINLQEAASPIINDVPAGTTFAFNPTEQSEFTLDVRPQFLGKYFGAFGPTKRISTITTTPNSPPAITTQPQNRVIILGAEAAFSVAATGTAPLAYQWKVNGVDVVETADVQGSRTATLTLRSVQTGQAGNYTVVVTGPSGSTTSNPAVLTVNPAPTLPTVVDVPTTTPVDTGGDANWGVELAGDPFADPGAPPRLGAAANAAPTILTSFTHDGEDSARSGRIGHNEQTYIDFTASGPATLSFWWRVDSEPDYDFLELQVDGVALFRISGEVDWEQRTVALAEGDHQLRWVYRKDGSGSSGADAGWLDQIELYEEEEALTFNEALNTDKINWISSGDLPWFTTTEFSHDGLDAAQSGPVDDNEESRLEGIVVGPAELSFWWQVDAEIFDSLSFELDGVTLFEKLSSISGGDEEIVLNTDWERKKVSIPAGTHRVSWVYRKDDEFSEGLDAGFVDEVTLTKPTPGQGGEPGPTLVYQASGKKLRLSWTDGATGAKLQTSTTLTPPNWQDIPANQIQRGDSEFFILLDSSIGEKFYRLSQP